MIYIMNGDVTVSMQRPPIDKNRFFSNSLMAFFKPVYEKAMSYIDRPNAKNPQKVMRLQLSRSESSLFYFILFYCVLCVAPNNSSTCPIRWGKLIDVM